ncbi:hypothetical protein GOP47_0017595 [Adiantum capillus-veneris]|uniref:Denticleless protein homolog n=1 Tax=Adiantum capillus-veneris TaxID=13818 RepID=A0A9D4UG36_ADICA|nr:hypothetical protein GOP47_0017595 [Adiantum capillus-veneris]
MHLQAGASSIFSALKSRELCNRRVGTRPSVTNMTADGACPGSGVLVVEPNGTVAPPLAISFGKTVEHSHLLAVADEEGFVSIFNTCRKLPSSLNAPRLTDSTRKEFWLAHSNAIFDICWAQDDRHMLTASGDQTVRLWDIEARAGLGVMKGHSGSVKSLCVHPSQPELYASGSRDGSVAIWDVRSSSSHHAANERSFLPVSMVKGAHILKQRKRVRGSKGVTMSVTAVLFLKDETMLATAGAADGIVKFWDFRQLKSPVVQTPPQEQMSTECREKRVHGISGLSLNPSGTSLIASSTNSRIYVYDMHRPEKGSVKSFQGHVLGSFYIKAAFSPEGTHILSGSSDGNVFIWQMDSPESAPIVLKGHGGEVTAVDWCPTDFCKIATCSDDYTVRIWKNIEPSFKSVTQPSAIRRRITADPSCDATEARLCERIDCSSPSPSSEVMLKVGDLTMRRCTSSEDSLTSQESSAKESLGNMEASQFLDCTSQTSKSFQRSETSISTKQPMNKSPVDLSPSSVFSLPSASKRRKTIMDYYGC